MFGIQTLTLLIFFQVGTADFIEELQRRTFPEALDNNVVADVSGTQLTLPYLNQTGFRNPVLVDEMEGLGLGMPDQVKFQLHQHDQILNAPISFVT